MINRLFFATLLVLGACDRSTSYYSDHKGDRSEVVRACAQGLERGRNCDNAATAVVVQRHREAEKAFRSGLDKP